MVHDRSCHSTSVVINIIIDIVTINANMENQTMYFLFYPSLSFSSHHKPPLRDEEGMINGERERGRENIYFFWGEEVKCGNTIKHGGGNCH